MPFEIKPGYGDEWGLGVGRRSVRYRGRSTVRGFGVKGFRKTGQEKRKENELRVCMYIECKQHNGGWKKAEISRDSGITHNIW